MTTTLDNLTLGRGRFVSIKGYHCNEGGVADHVVNGAPSYESVLRSAVAALADVTPEDLLASVPALSEDGVRPTPKEVETLRSLGRDNVDAALDLPDAPDAQRWLVAVLALHETRASLEKSLARLSRPADGKTSDGRHDPYTRIAPGLKRHEDGSLHVSGLAVSKTVLAPADRKPRKSRVKTIAKGWCRNQTPLAKWRQFKLTTNHFTSLTAEGTTIHGTAAAVEEIA